MTTPSITHRRVQTVFEEQLDRILQGENAKRRDLPRLSASTSRVMPRGPARPQSRRSAATGRTSKRTGDLEYAPVVSFINKETRDKFSNAILDALRSSHPEALAP